MFKGKLPLIHIDVILFQIHLIEFFSTILQSLLNIIILYKLIKIFVSFKPEFLFNPSLKLILSSVRRRLVFGKLITGNPGAVPLYQTKEVQRKYSNSAVSPKVSLEWKMLPTNGRIVVYWGNIDFCMLFQGFTGVFTYSSQSCSGRTSLFWNTRQITLRKRTGSLSKSFLLLLLYYLHSRIPVYFPLALYPNVDPHLLDSYL